MLTNDKEVWFNQELEALIGLLDDPKRANNRNWMIFGAITSFYELKMIERTEYLKCYKKLDKIYKASIQHKVN